MHSLHASKIEGARVNEEAPSFQLGCESRPYKWLRKSVLVQPAQGHLLYGRAAARLSLESWAAVLSQLSSDGCCGGVDRGVHCSGLHEVMF